jgi:hypothetical protein
VTDYRREGTVSGRCTAVDVVRSTARSPTLVFSERTTWPVAVQQCTCERVCVRLDSLQ